MSNDWLPEMSWNRSSDVSSGGTVICFPRRMVVGVGDGGADASERWLVEPVEPAERDFTALTLLRNVLPPQRSRLLTSHFRAWLSMSLSVSFLNFSLLVFLTAAANNMCDI